VQSPVIQADFVISAVSETDFPKEGIPEIVFAGRSNVGKSSLINTLTGKAALARTSSTPGKTQTINFYRINRSCFFVDLPGFGYAKAGKSTIRQWKDLIEGYFLNRKTIAIVVQLIDSRIPPTKQDLQLFEWMESWKIPLMLVGTKSDKLSNNQKSAQMRIFLNSFSGRAVVMSSTKTGIGCKEIMKRVLEAAAIVKSPRE
jgi:GTP-binding protein